LFVALLLMTRQIRVSDGNTLQGILSLKEP